LPAAQKIGDFVIGKSGTTQVAVLFSGGLDSAILLGQMLAAGRRVWPLFVDCQWHWQPAELRAARGYLHAMRQSGLEELVELQMPLADLYHDHWSITGRLVPRAGDPDENVYLPGHNPLLLVKAQVWCRLHGVEQLALGSLASNPFADSTEDFFQQFEAAMDRAISGHVELVRPLGHLTKRQVMQLGQDLPLERTFSCLSPVDGRHCGQCNKCAERQQAFRLADLPDPTTYASPAPTPLPSH
jgi:7-cyano-7-deazaguanine synthase